MKYEGHQGQQEHEIRWEALNVPLNGLGPGWDAVTRENNEPEGKLTSGSFDVATTLLRPDR